MLYTLLENSAKAFPNNIVLCTDDYSCTYKELHETIQKLATGLSSIGLTKGDRVASYLDNCPQAIQLCFACFKIGISVVMICPSLRQDEIKLLLQETRPKLFVTQLKLYETSVQNLIDLFPNIIGYYLIDAEVNKNNKMLLHLSNLIINNNDKQDGLIDIINADQEATIFDTSGTTGKSKCVVMNHQAHIAVVNGFNNYCEFNDKDLFLLASSMNTTIGFRSVILPAIQHGSSIYYYSTELSYPDKGKKIAQILCKKRVTFTQTTPSIWKYTLDELKIIFNQNNTKNLLRPYLRYCIICGEKLSRRLLEQTKEYLGHYPIDNYGLTECGAVGITPIHEYLATNSMPEVGRYIAFGDKKIRITKYDNWDNLPINTLGEITVYSKANMTHYLNDAETTNQVLNNGWLKTGDIGYLDENGYLYLVGRKKLIITYDGDNINVEELEESLLKHENIKEACVTSIKLVDTFEAPVAYITLEQPDEDHTKIIEEIYSYLHQHIATYKIPKYIKILPNLPRLRKTNKIDRQLMAKRALEDFRQLSE